MPSTLTVIRDATDRIEAADDQLGELNAMVELNRLVRKATSNLILIALQTYSASEVARATGQTRQYMNRRKATPSPERKVS
jgi:hypothetical protein